MPGYVAEIFSSVQGEGLLVGCRQVFIRLSGCNIHCAYCDTPVDKTTFCRIEREPGGRVFTTVSNPVEATRVATVVQGFDLSIHHSVSFTGGEPLLHISFIKELIPLIRGFTRQGIYLETNGTLPEKLALVIHLFDLIGMDIKLPSVSGLPNYWKEHLHFLEIAASRQAFVKVVIGENTPDAEIKQSAELISACSREIPLIIQPVTGYIKTVSPERVLYLQKLALRQLTNVLIIPQTHKIMHQL